MDTRHIEYIATERTPRKGRDSNGSRKNTPHDRLGRKVDSYETQGLLRKRKSKTHALGKRALRGNVRSLKARARARLGRICIRKSVCGGVRIGGQTDEQVLGRGSVDVLLLGEYRTEKRNESIGLRSRRRRYGLNFETTRVGSIRCGLPFMG